MIKRITTLLFVLALAAFAQSTGKVTVDVVVTAAAGPLSCTATIRGDVANTMHMKCSSGVDTYIDTDFKVPSTGAVMYSITLDKDSVTWILSKGNPTPDRWEVSANGVMKSGSF